MFKCNKMHIWWFFMCLVFLLDLLTFPKMLVFQIVTIYPLSLQSRSSLVLQFWSYWTAKGTYGFLLTSLIEEKFEPQFFFFQKNTMFLKVSKSQIRAEILAIFRSFFGRNDAFINSFWDLLTFTRMQKFSDIFFFSSVFF